MSGTWFYRDLADWWPLFSSPAEYADEAGVWVDLLRGTAAPPCRSLLELGSGGGNNALHLKAHFEEVVLVDVAEPMLDVSRRLNAECAHVVGDMRSVRLGRTFDAVFVHDAVVYMTTAADLAAAIQTAVLHCRPGGAVLFAPDFVAETFRAGTSSGGHDAADGDRGFRYLEWVQPREPNATTYAVDYLFALRDGREAPPRIVHERHVEGVFPIGTWLGLLQEADVEARAVDVDVGEDGAPTTVFVGRRR